MRELQRAAAQDDGVRGWFSLELDDPRYGRVTRLGAITKDATLDELLAIRFATDSSERLQGLGSGWVFALDYEVLGNVPKPMIGMVDSSILMVHRDGSVRIERSGSGNDSRINETVLRRALYSHGEDHDPGHGDHSGVSLRDVQWHTGDEEYLSQVVSLTDALRDVPNGVACLTNRITVTHGEVIDPVTVYAALAASSEPPRGGVIVMDGRALVSASPETFFDVESGRIRTSPMKGTRARGTTAEDDAVLREELQTSEKEILENQAVTNGIVNELIPLCVEDSVRITAPCRVLTFKQVHQMVSDVEGILPPGTKLLNLLQATFPATSMVGIPKLEMLHTLAEIEGVSRNLYSGTYGWISSDQHSANLSMAIRCAELEGNRAVVGAGGGITALSDPESELGEVKLKARAVLNALGAGYP